MIPEAAWCLRVKVEGVLCRGAVGWGVTRGGALVGWFGSHCGRLVGATFLRLRAHFPPFFLLSRLICMLPPRTHEYMGPGWGSGLRVDGREIRESRPDRKIKKCGSVSLTAPGDEGQGEAGALAEAGHCVAYVVVMVVVECCARMNHKAGFVYSVLCFSVLN